MWQQIKHHHNGYKMTYNYSLLTFQGKLSSEGKMHESRKSIKGRRRNREMEKKKKTTYHLRSEHWKSFLKESWARLNAKRKLLLSFCSLFPCLVECLSPPRLYQPKIRCPSLPTSILPCWSLFQATFVWCCVCDKRNKLLFPSALWFSFWHIASWQQIFAQF